MSNFLKKMMSNIIPSIISEIFLNKNRVTLMISIIKSFYILKSNGLTVMDFNLRIESLGGYL